MATYDDLVLADSPALYWPLDDPSGSTATDASGNGLHGTYLGAPELGVDGPRTCTDEPDQAVFFDGNGTDNASSDVVWRSTSPVAGSGDMSWEVWVRPEADSFTRSGRRYMNLIQQRQTPASYTGMVRVFTSSQGGAFGTAEGIGLILVDQVRISADLALISSRTECWSHVAVTKAGNLWTLYFNGSPVGTHVQAHAVTSQHLSFGGDYPDLGPRQTIEEMELWRGRMAKAAVYGYALDQEQLGQRVGLGCIGCGSGFVAGTALLG